MSSQAAARSGRALDRDLVTRAQAGDEIAFAELAAQIGDRMYATAQHILHDAGRAEDAVQQAMIDIWRNLPRLADPDRFSAWAYRIVVRAAYAEVRQRRLWRRRPASTLDGRRSAPDHAGRVADEDELASALRRISLEHRTILVLKHFNDLSNAEIADVLDIPEGTVRSRLHHGMRSLRAAVEADARQAARELT